MLKITTTSAALAAVLLAAAPRVHAQAPQDIGHRQAEDFAAWLAGDGQYAKAAGLYAQAYEEKSKRAYAYQAAELYFFVKDYAKAVQFYAIAAESDEEQFDDARLKLARAQQRMAHYAAARAAYEAYADGYTGADSAKMRASVALELQGVDLAEDERLRVDPTIFVDKLGGAVNGMKNELAPIHFEGDELTFLSDFDGTVRAYTTASTGNGGWEQMRPAEHMPYVEEGHLGGATLVTPDRFYFGLCDQRQNMAQPAVECQLYVAEREGGSWLAPKKLPETINPGGATAAQPFAFVEGNKEVLIFATDRANGYGGMDLWRAERPVSGSVDDWSAPVNLGPKVNGPGNEVTPFYETETRVLSFSTDRAGTMGGYDVMHATAADASLVDFAEAVNSGSPVNSSGDDYYYRTVPGSSKAYLASNRAKDMSRTRMVNDDLYAVSYDTRNVTVEIGVVDRRTGEPVSDPTMTVKLNPDGRLLKPLTVRRSLDGYFELTLPVDREVTLEVTRPYYDDATAMVTIPSGSSDGHAVNPVRIGRTDVGEDEEVMVVWRAAGRGEAAKPPKADEAPVVTASGDEDEDGGQ